MLNGPFSPWPDFDAEEKQAVLEVLDSNQVNYWTGQKGREFEKQFAAYFDTNFAIAVANGTVALDLAWQALELPKGSEVIVTSRTFIASISSIVLAGLTPVFADIDAANHISLNHHLQLISLIFYYYPSETIPSVTFCYKLCGNRNMLEIPYI